MEKSKIDWTDSSWNPITGCYHGCEYCYARSMVKRFSPIWAEPEKNRDKKNIIVLDEPYIGGNGRKQPYPWGFLPTFHRYRLNDYRDKKGRTIFVCSMADMFGEWVPDEWIIEILEACRNAPQHRYLFLTKNPRRYDELEDAGIITEKDTNFWLGSTTTVITRDLLHYNRSLHTFQSCEPMLAPWPPAGEPNRTHLEAGDMPEWVIFGAETGNRAGKVIPKKEWVVNAVQMCRNIGAKVFMKESLRDLMGEDFIQEFPWKEDK